MGCKKKEKIVHFSDCGIGRVKVCVFMRWIGALMKRASIKIVWETLTLHFMVFRSLCFAEGDDLPPIILNPTLM